MGCVGEQITRVTQSITIPKHSKCYGYGYINKGDTGVLVNQTYLKPYPPGRPDLSGEAYFFVDPLGRHVSNDFQITFDAAPGAAPQLELHQYHEQE